MAGCCCATPACRAAARMCATARPPSPCTCCGACSVASPASSGRRSRPGSPRARLFVAMDLPDDARTQLVDWRADAFAGRDDVRLVDPAALHVTLVFLGWIAEKQIPQ